MNHKPECNETACYCRDEELGDAMCSCGYISFNCHCAEQASDDPKDDYWMHQRKTILVSITITYHEPTDVLVSFEKPTFAQLEQAIRTDRDRTNKLIEIRSKLAALMALFAFDKGAEIPVPLREAAELIISLTT